MSSKKYIDNFEKLYSLFTEIYLTFYTWKGLQEKEYEPVFKKDSNFWGATLYALENSWLTGLAKAYENSRYSEKGTVISVYALLKEIKDTDKVRNVEKLLNKNTKAIKLVTALRHKQLAHNDVKHLLNPKKLLKSHVVKYGEIEDLINDSSKLLSLLNPEKGHGYSYQGFIEECISNSHSIVKKLKYYQKHKDLHVTKFLNREVDSIKMDDE